MQPEVINLPKTNASTPIITYANFQNQPSHTNIHLVPTNLEMKRLHLVNRLEQLCHVNQLVSIPHVEHVESIATPKIVQ
jgi:hypothetical protein